MDIMVDLATILEGPGVTVCFCTLCSHNESHGYCYFCRCHNHAEKPEPDDAKKLASALDHTKTVLVHLAESSARLQEQLQVARDALLAAPELHYPVGYMMYSPGQAIATYTDWFKNQRKSALRYLARFISKAPGSIVGSALQHEQERIKSKETK